MFSGCGLGEVGGIFGVVDQPAATVRIKPFSVFPALFAAKPHGE
jgi:hypothetical protein